MAFNLIVFGNKDMHQQVNPTEGEDGECDDKVQYAFNQQLADTYKASFHKSECHFF